MKTIFEIYESIVLEAMSLEDIYEKYYKNDVPDIRTFKEINMANPGAPKDKKGKYLDWLIRKAYKSAGDDKFGEDINKIAEDLEIFDKNQAKIGKQISQIKDQYELSKLVREFREKKEAGEIDLSRSETKKQAEKLLDADGWVIIHPKTKEAAKYYGANTRWCTAAETNNAFDGYNSEGPLYILINKKVPSEKYQLHFQEEQYMNSEDEPIVDDNYNKFKSGIFPLPVIAKLVELAHKNGKLFEFLKIIPIETAQLIKGPYKQEILNYHLLFECGRKNPDLNKIKDFVEQGADINYRGGEPLVVAISGLRKSILVLKHIEDLDISLIKYLVENGADVNSKAGAPVYIDNQPVGGMPLYRAATKIGCLKLVKYLVEKGADINKDPSALLVNTIANNRQDIFEWLVSKNIKIHDKHYLLRVAVDSGRTNMLSKVLEVFPDIKITKDDLSYAYNNSSVKMHLVLEEAYKKQNNESIKQS